MFRQNYIVRILRSTVHDVGHSIPVLTPTLSTRDARNKIMACFLHDKLKLLDNFYEEIEKRFIKTKNTLKIDEQNLEEPLVFDIYKKSSL